MSIVKVVEQVSGLGIYELHALVPIFKTSNDCT